MFSFGLSQGFIPMVVPDILKGAVFVSLCHSDSVPFVFNIPDFALAVVMITECDLMEDTKPYIKKTDFIAHKLNIKVFCNFDKVLFRFLLIFCSYGAKHSRVNKLKEKFNLLGNALIHFLAEGERRLISL